MNKNLTELVFIIDRSGSMSGLEQDTIGGFNNLLQKQRKEVGDAVVSVVLFDHVTEVLYDRVNIRRVEPMNDKQYFVRGSTAFQDALGGAIHHIKNVHRYIREEDVPAKTLFIITTDGMENSSRRYSLKEVRRMVEEQQEKENWEFLYYGANLDAVQEARKFGIQANRAVRFENDSFGTRLNYDVMSEAVSRARKSESAEAMASALDDEALLDPIRRDYNKRHRK